MLIFLECEFLRCVLFSVCTMYMRLEKQLHKKNGIGYLCIRNIQWGALKLRVFFFYHLRYAICNSFCAAWTYRATNSKKKVKKGSIELFFVCLFGMRWFDVQIMRYMRYKVYKKRATDFIFSSCVTISVYNNNTRNDPARPYERISVQLRKSPFVISFQRHQSSLSARRHWYFRQIEIVCLSFVFLYTYTLLLHRMLFCILHIKDEY